MKYVCKTALVISALILGVGLGAGTAQAQATRTWVSGVGDDANPCSRTAPCKTFAGAISKTAAGGEINCLDPGGFGAVTITKSITISCPYTEGGALAAANGIVVNAGASDVVVLRGLDIFGVNPPLNGIRFVAGGALHIEDCVIRRFNAATSAGVMFAPSGSSQLFITNTVITENGGAANGAGIFIQPTGVSGSARALLRNVRVLNNGFAGLRVDGTATSSAGMSITVEDSQFVGQASGILVNSDATSAIVLVNNSIVANNTSNGIQAVGTGSAVRVGNTTVHANANGINPSAGGVIISYGDNRVDGNFPDGTFSSVIPKK